jgi:transcriptional regulator with XRE-family HTH domain
MNPTMNRTTDLAKFVEDRVEELKGTKLQSEIAREAGYKSPNMITMIKQGNAKVAIDRVPDLSKALDVDPALLLRLALAQFYTDETVAVLTSSFKKGMLTQNETKILSAIRAASNDSDPTLTPDLEEKIQRLF